MAAEYKQLEEEDDNDLDPMALSKLHFSTNPKNNRKRKHMDIDDIDPFENDEPVNKKRKITINNSNDKENNHNNSNTNNSSSSLQSVNNDIFSHSFKVKFSVFDIIPIQTIFDVANGIKKEKIKIIPYPPQNPENQEIIQLYINAIHNVESCLNHNKSSITFKMNQKRLCDNEATLKFKEIIEEKKKLIQKMQRKEKEKEEKELALLNNAWSKIFKKPKQTKLKQLKLKFPEIPKLDDNTTGIYEMKITLNINTNLHNTISNISLSSIFELSLNSKEINNICQKNKELMDQFKNEDDNNNNNKYTLPNVLDLCCRYKDFDDDDVKSNIDNDDESKYRLNVKLFGYQRQSIKWMINEEKHCIGFHRHFYAKYRYNNNNNYFYYSPTLQHLIFNKELPRSHGGFLCEEMGLGKTIETLALINYNKILNKERKNNNNTQYSTSWKLVLSHTENVEKRIIPQHIDDIPYYVTVKHSYYASSATLIIGCVSLIGQWEKECVDKSKIKLKMKRYYGSRKRDIKLYIDQDIVFTTYGILGKEDGNDRNNHILHNIEWQRIILDESHYIKNGVNCCSRNINNLRGKNKWCLTGTPFGRRIDDILNQMIFIGFNNMPRIKDYGEGNYYNIWHFVIKMIKPICMRHKKDQLFNNVDIVKMTPKQEGVIYIDFITEQQRKYYNKLYLIAKERYKSFKQTGNIGRGLISILSSLLPARQACSGCIYSKSEIQNELNTAQKRNLSISQIVNNNINENKSRLELYRLANEYAFNMNDEECPICFETPFDDPLQTKCRHIFCGECIKGIIINKPQCPLCRKQCLLNDLQRPPSKQNDMNDIDINGDNNNNIKFDQKLKALISELNKLKQRKPDDKILIFTSFTKSLNWMCSELTRNGFRYKTLTGSMSMNKRKKELEEFINNKNIKIFILTVRSGAVGITLNAANHIFMMEPPFNNSLYKQAINRVHRLGQKKKVYINTFIMKDSIEEKIWNVNKEKELKNNHNNNNNNNNNNNDLCGNISDDKRAKFKQHEVSKLFE